MSYNRNRVLPSTQFYNGNPRIPKANLLVTRTQQEEDEYIKCMEDPIYFAKNYIKIVHVDHGLMPFDMWDFQEDMLTAFHERRFVICKLPRQVGKTTTTVAYILHLILFTGNQSIAILANKGELAQEILERLKLAYEYLPRFLQQGITTWNKRSIELENGSKVKAAATGASSVRGGTYNLIFLDEFAHVPNNTAEPFFTSTYPVISSGKTTKVIIVSTPLGMNHFYKKWSDTEKGLTEYYPISVHWSNVPGRDEEWKRITIANTSEEQFAQEFECEFLGSTNTLISGAKLKTLTFKTPVFNNHEGFTVFEEPIKNHTYTISVDVANGQGLDMSAFSIIDVTQIPYKQVARYRNNKVSTLIYPSIIFSAAKRYNEAFVLVEISSIGQEVANILHFDLAYENLIKVEMRGKIGQQVTGGYKKQKVQMGLKTSIATKRIGCANLKALVEGNKLIINDEDTVMELYTFIAHKESFAAEEGKYDDLAMSLVNFAWLSSQTYFRESIGNDIRRNLQEEQLRIMDNDIVPFGVIDDGLSNTGLFDADGDLWIDAKTSQNPFYYNDLDGPSAYPFGPGYSRQL